MNDEVVIKAENLGKKYRLGAGRSNERYTALRDVIANSVSAPFRRLRNGRSKIEDRSSGNAPPTSNSHLLTSGEAPSPNSLRAIALSLRAVGSAPEDVPLKDIAREIDFIAGVREGFEQMERGEGLPAEDVRAMVPSWVVR